jgi:beta-glucosidase
MLFSKLREWNFSGFVTTDCGAIEDFYYPDRHHTHPDAEHAVADAVRNGTMLECGSSFDHLGKAVRMGLIDNSYLTKAVKILFKQRINLGMFDPPEMVNYTRIPYSVIRSEKHAKHARLMARESVVLLKNDGILPLSNLKKLLVVGPNADQVSMLWGNYNGVNFRGTTTILDALNERAKVEFYPGCEYVVNDSVGIDLWQEITAQKEIGFEAKFYPNMDLREPATLAKHVSRLRWIDGSEDSFGGDFQRTHYSVEFGGSFRSTKTETLEIRLQWDYGARFDFGDSIHVEHWNDKQHGNCVIPVNVKVGPEYKLHVAYRHNMGSGVFQFLIKHNITVEESLKQIKASVPNVRGQKWAN